jgi:hypothetical protein
MSYTLLVNKNKIKCIPDYKTAHNYPCEGQEGRNGK